MQAPYFNKIKKLVSKLNKNEGHFIIQSGSFNSAKSKDTDVFCQMYKKKDKSSIYIEAVSHFFNPTVSKNLKTPSSKLGYTYDEDGYYSKEIIINSSKDLLNITLEIQEIFENIYKVEPDSIYEFDDQIEVQHSPEHTSKYEPTPNIENNQQPTTSMGGFGLLIILSIIALVVYSLVDTGKTTNEKPKIYVANSKLDNSVYQVENYIKRHYLFDPESFSVLEWGNVMKMDNIREVGHGSYVVTVRFRAKNSFGNFVIESKIVSLDFKGNVTEFLDLPTHLQ